MLHFNAHSIGNKFDLITAKIASLNPSVVCITETWLTAKSAFNLYQFDGYTAYFNSRKLMEHKGVMILIKSSLTSKSLTQSFTPCDSYNVCAISVGRKQRRSLIAVVYRTPSANLSKTKDLCVMLNSFVTRHNYSDVIVAGDFNVPGVKWNTEIVYYAGAESVISRFAIDHSLVQVATKPTRRDALLDLVFVPLHLHNVEVENVAPMGKSDHDGQVFSLPYNAVDESHNTLVLAVDYEQLSFKLQFVDWSSSFAGCVGANEYTE